MQITILGSTGSIGSSTLEVVRQNPDQFKIYGLVAGRSLGTLCSQILEFRPFIVSVMDEEALDDLKKLLEEAALPRKHWPELTTGPDSKIAVATASPVQFVMSSIVGVAGLEATYAAIKKKKRIGLANKEALVASGRLVMQAVRESGTEMIPVDSEHNGAHQCFRAGDRSEVTRLILTASGGPFRATPEEELRNVTPKQALNHPTWKMGPRITVDSATLMNKGFEVIEACWLFNLPPSQVDVVVHPQSSIHAMVEYVDGTVIAQVSATDMKMPIQYAMTYPKREKAPVPQLDWTQARTWNFFPPDTRKFPLLQLAYDAQEQGGSATCTLNAADEVAVQAFLDHRISFPAIAEVVEETLLKQPCTEPASIHQIIEIDRQSREVARQVVERHPAP